MHRKFEIKEEYTRESTAILAGLIGIGVVIVQALIGTHATDLPAVIALLAFAIALPILGMFVILTSMLPTGKKPINSCSILRALCEAGTAIQKGQIKVYGGLRFNGSA